MFIDPNKPNIRLPHDLGANPYDSKTKPEELGPQWLISWQWWFTIIAMGGGITLARYWGTGSL